MNTLAIVARYLHCIMMKIGISMRQIYYVIVYLSDRLV